MTSKQPSEPQFLSPLKLIAITVLIISIVEAIIMLGFMMLPVLTPTGELFVDTFFMSIATLAVLYFAMYIPMQRHLKSQAALQDEIYYRALHDNLTGLPNRALFTDRMDNEIERSNRHTGQFVLIIFDIDRFKEINDTLGHYNGDKLLAQISQRLKNHWRKSDTIARFGADEFSIMLPGADQDVAIIALEKLQNFIKEPYHLENTPLEIEVHCGIALFPEHGETATQLMQHADTALNNAKSLGKEYDVYQQENDIHTVQRLSLFGELRHAIENDELVLHYQPKLNLLNKNMLEVEALIRWNHPTRGFICPDQFIPIAERTNLIKPLTLWVIETAFKQIKSWQEHGFNIRVAVNLSARNLNDPSIVNSFRDMMNTLNIPPDRLVGEVTESAVMADSERSNNLLNELHELGIDISIDDFGTGFGSLTYLRTLPIKEIKIDQSFVKEINRSESDQHIVQSLIQLAHNLKLTVTAEGIDSEEVYNTLKQMGCDKIQGYFICKPVPADELEAAYTHLLKEA
ncbi:MAG: EAL domain-containing protein [Methylococcales bacterium]|nr:EAL domain-containing protein [Methylococcales bacterium]MBT7443883.1 EAL domain-containing protein [Methylococcales bacterium]